MGGLLATIGLVLFPQVVLTSILALTILLIVAGFAIVPVSSVGFHLDVSLRPSTDSDSASDSVLTLCAQHFVPTGFDRRLMFEIEIRGWTILWLAVVAASGGLIALQLSDVPLLYPLDTGHVKYPAIYISIYLSIILLSIALGWISERIFLRNAVPTIGSIQKFDKAHLIRRVHYEFRDTPGNVRGSIEPAASLKQNDRLLLVFFHRQNPDKSKPADALTFHRIRLAATQPSLTHTTSAW